MFKAFGTLLSGSLLGKILGLLRETILAGFFGTQAPVGAYRTSQTATLIPITFFTSDSLTAGFIPLYTKFLAESDKKAQSFLWAVLSVLLIFTLLISLGLAVLSHLWVSLLAPGFNEYAFSLTTSFVKIMALGLPFYTIGILFSYVGIGNKQYLLSSIRSSIQSIGLIIGTLLAFWLENPGFLAWGFTASYILYFFISLRSMIKNKYIKTPVISKESLYLAKDLLLEFWIVIRPLLLLPLLLQGNVAIERIVSSFMGVETVASLDYAKFITETGILLISVPIGLIGLTELSSLPPQRFKEVLQKIVLTILLVTVPVSCYLGLYSEFVVRILYERGSFGLESVYLTKEILIGLSIGFWAQILAYILIKSLNSQFRNKEVILLMAVALSTNSLFNLLFYKFLGPITLGIGASLYGIVLFFLTLKVTGLLNRVRKDILILFLMSMAYIAFSLVLQVDNMLLSVIIFMLYWGSAIFSFSRWRILLVSMFEKVIN